MASEKRLIDTSQYKSFLKRYIKELYEIDAPMIAGAVERCLYKLEGQPTVDAVEVVRCKDCIYYHKKLGIGFGQCSKCTLMPYPEDFCSYGERKDNG